MSLHLNTFSIQKSKSCKVHCIVGPVDRVFIVTFGAEDACCIEALMRFHEERCYNRPISHSLNRHAIPEKMPDEGVLRCACNIGPGEYLDREPLTRLHQQIKSKSGEVFARALVLPGCNHKEVDI